MDKATRKAIQKARRKFDKITDLAFTKTPEARKASKAMSDLWVKRQPTLTKGLWKAENARA